MVLLPRREEREETMALQPTVYRFHVLLSHVDRGVYETLDLRVAAHPSESAAFLLTRVLAYAFLTEEGIGFSKGGLSDPDEPALSIRSLDGRLTAWIEVGVPSAARLHKAAKLCKRVVVVAHKNRQGLLDEVASQEIHRKAELELYAVDEGLLRALEPSLEKTTRWEVTFSDGQVYVVAGGATHAGELERLAVG
jgi:uncharacterized protein YaeQ